VRAGGSVARPLDVRIIVATTRNLDRDVENGRFREDLFSVVSARRVELPPLRHREGDARLLTTHFWQRMNRTGRPVPPDLLAHVGNAFRGNVEELERAVAERLAADAPQLDVGAAPLPPMFENVLASNLSWGEARQRVLAEFEKVFLLRMLEQHGGNVTRAAEAAGIARRHFHRLKARHGR
jgi:DNA-binding NtrC family response regulator